MIKGVATDIDGTFLDTDDLHERAWRKAFVDNQLGFLTHEEYERNFQGISGDRSRPFVEARFRSWWSPDEDVERSPLETTYGFLADSAASSASKNYASLAALHGLKAFSDVFLLLLQARASGMKIGYASSSGNAKHSLESLTFGETLHSDDVSRYRLDPKARLRELFDDGISGVQGYPGKPSPDIYHAISARLGIAAAELLVLEDSPAGVESAMKAGAFCVAINRNGSLKALAAKSPNILYDATNAQPGMGLNLAYLLRTAQQ